jgi:hypothetical protein
MENLKKKCKETVKDQDFFGHPISWNFDKQGDSHNTLIGGIFSVFIKLFFLFFVTTKVKQFLYKEESNNTSATILLKLD